MVRGVQRSPYLALLVLWVGLCMTQQARAQARPARSTPAVESKEYRRTISDALREFDVGNWEEALSLFERAHALQPNARTLRGIGFCLFEMRRYVATVDTLEQSLSDARNPLTASQQAGTRELLERARGFVAQISLELEPAAGELRVDGAPQTLPSGGTLRLDPGDHELAYSADGYQPDKLRVQAKSGSNPPVRLVLEPVKPALAASAPATPARAPEPSASALVGRDRAPLKRSMMIGGFALAGASVVTFAVAGGLALKQSKALKDACPDDACPDDQRDELARADRLVLTSNVALGLTAAGAALGLVGLFLPNRADRPSVRAQLGRGLVGLQLTSRF